MLADRERDARRDTGQDAGRDAGSTEPSMIEHWREVVTTALLGTDRRDPPAVGGAIADVVDDTVPASPSERMLAQVAACAAVRRAGFVPGPGCPLPAAPDVDARPECLPAAIDRWHHVCASWPVLEDEWTIALITNGWRLAAELVPLALRRHRSDPVRHARVRVAAGPVADWLIEQVPDLACTKAAVVDPERLAELDELPISPDVLGLLHAPGGRIGAAVGAGIEHGEFALAHRAVLVNLLARMAPDGLADVAAALDAVDSRSAGYGLATVLSDLATTRHRMLTELA